MGRCPKVFPPTPSVLRKRAEHFVFDVPELLGEVDVVVMGVAEAADLVPHTGELGGTMIADFLKGGELIDR